MVNPVIHLVLFDYLYGYLPIFLFSICFSCVFPDGSESEIVLPHLKIWFHGDLLWEFIPSFFYVFLLWVWALPITIEVRKILNVTNYYWIFSAFGNFWDLPPSSQVCVFSSKKKKNFHSYIFYGSFTFVFIGSLLCCTQLANWHNFLMSNQCKRVVPRRVTQQGLARLSSLCCCCYSLSGAKHDSHINNFLTLISKGKKHVGCVLFTLLGNGKVG